MAFRIRSSNQHQQPMAVILYSFARPAEGNTLNFYIMLMVLNTMKMKWLKLGVDALLQFVGFRPLRLQALANVFKASLLSTIHFTPLP